MAMGRAEPIGTTSGKPEWYPVKPKKSGATQGLPRRSPILVLFSPKRALLRSSDGIRFISAGMIAPVMFLCRSPLKPIVSDRCNHVISRSMHHGPPSSLLNMSSSIPYGTHPLHQAFPPITFASTIQKVCSFHQLSSNDGIFHAKLNGKKIIDERFRRPISCDRLIGSTIARRRWRWGGPNPWGGQVASPNGNP